MEPHADQGLGEKNRTSRLSHFVLCVAPRELVFVEVLSFAADLNQMERILQVPSTNLAPFSGKTPTSAGAAGNLEAAGGSGAPPSSGVPSPSATDCAELADQLRVMPPMRTSSPAPTLKLPASSHDRGGEGDGAVSTASARSEPQVRPRVLGFGCGVWASQADACEPECRRRRSVTLIILAVEYS